MRLESGVVGHRAVGGVPERVFEDGAAAGDEALHAVAEFFVLRPERGEVGPCGDELFRGELEFRRRHGGEPGGEEVRVGLERGREGLQEVGVERGGIEDFRLELERRGKKLVLVNLALGGGFRGHRRRALFPSAEVVSDVHAVGFLRGEGDAARPAVLLHPVVPAVGDHLEFVLRIIGRLLEFAELAVGDGGVSLRL